MKKKYDPIKIEKKIQYKWKKKNSFQALENFNKKKYYCVPMLPYPSGKLHIGHVRNYTISDVISRYQRMLGKNVLQPIGWDAFGLPAEIAAIKNKQKPKEWTKKNIQYMKKQLQSLGFSYDWTREISTCNPKYYKWEQWFFIQLYKKKLIYKKTSLVKWCKKDKTVLANEQVIKGKCWRCDTKVILKNIPQWFLKIRKYAEELYQDLKKLKMWPKKVKNMQKNWIGRTKGIEINLKLKKSKKFIQGYTIRPYSLLDAKYIAISPDHKLIPKLIDKNSKIYEFTKKQKKKLASVSNFKKIQNIGIKTNEIAINPLNKKELPIWIANFVSIEYGTNIIIASPKHNLIERNFYKKNINYLRDNFSKISQKKIKKKNKKILIQIKNKKIGKIKKKYKLQDWNISRQRYWGTPIPIATTINNQIITIPEKQLPVLLPKFDDYYNKKKLKNWINIKINGIKAIRERDTFDTFIESSWYYARYTCPNFSKKMIDFNAAKYWLPIDQYIGGIEHSTMHLIYFRFYHKLLRDFNLVSNDEPVKKLLCQGMVLSDAFYYLNHENTRVWINQKKLKIKKNNTGKIISIKNLNKKKVIYAGIMKMSKSKNNGINPQKIIKKYGADSIRLFIMFAAPIESDLYWNENGLKGMNRFLKKIWNICYKNISIFKKNKKKYFNLNQEKKKKIYSNLFKTVSEVSEDIQHKQSFNTAISHIMKFFKYLKKYIIKNNNHCTIIRKCLIIILKLLSPFTPHFSYKILKEFKKQSNFNIHNWPKINQKYIISKINKIIIQINGKMSCIISTKKKLSEKEIFNIAIKEKKVIQKLHTKKIIKKFFIPDKILNLITI
ncbi:leucine--tRNA ligase [Buchnera aphidicola]|uniref:leucine--tRNA ligase n=1 Tax=Buchnera aphidicola TaxID=9 RepID=UPI002238FB30|nr:leucine--tRNA ligase [Buchnera aphidicola]MCW5197545.1 leucine--tRNA ligase [Buchnera aphidicola (Chaitophorus viminalis)]